MSTVTAETTSSPHRSLLHAAGTTVEVAYESPEDVFMRVTTPGDAPDPSTGARLLCAAVSAARTRHTRRLRTVFEAASPSCWTVQLNPPRLSRPRTGVLPGSAGPASRSTSDAVPHPARTHPRRTP